MVGSCLLQVSIEFGLSEMLNSMAIRPKVAPKDGKFNFNISDLEAMFPEGMVDHDVDPVYKEVINLSRPSFCFVSVCCFLGSNLSYKLDDLLLSVS